MWCQGSRWGREEGGDDPPLLVEGITEKCREGASYVEREDAKDLVIYVHVPPSHRSGVLSTLLQRDLPLMAQNQHDLFYINCVCVCVHCVCVHVRMCVFEGKVLRLIHGMNFFIQIEWSVVDPRLYSRKIKAFSSEP